MTKTKLHIILLLSMYSMTHATDHTADPVQVQQLEQELANIGTEILAIRREERHFNLSQGIEDRRSATDEQREKMDALYDEEIPLIHEYEGVLQKIAKMTEPSLKDSVEKECSEIDKRAGWFIYLKNLKSIEQLEQRESDIKEEIDRIEERIKRENKSVNMSDFEDIAKLSLPDQIKNQLQGDLLGSLITASDSLKDCLGEIKELIRLNQEKAIIEVARSQIEGQINTLFDEKRKLSEVYRSFKKEIGEYHDEAMSRQMLGFSSNFKGEEFEEMEKKTRNMERSYREIEPNLSESAKLRFNEIYTQLEQNINLTMELLQKDEELKTKLLAEDEEIQKIIDPQAPAE